MRKIVYYYCCKVHDFRAQSSQNHLISQRKQKHAQMQGITVAVRRTVKSNSVLALTLTLSLQIQLYLLALHEFQLINVLRVCECARISEVCPDISHYFGIKPIDTDHKISF